jgi:hypothetical protein
MCLNTKNETCMPLNWRDLVKRVLAGLNVENFDQWKLTYESRELVRQQLGCKGTSIYR